MTDTRAPRPTDLVALVTFDGEVRENLAVTRERLAEPTTAPKPLSAAIEQWLHLGRRTWVSVAGRQIRGIATARELGARCAWEIDTLIDADDRRADGRVIADLLRQAAVAAAQGEATHLLLRTAEDSPAAEAALRCGFSPVIAERLWSGQLVPSVAESSIEVRDLYDADTFAVFQLYSRAWPIAARQALAMTIDEWRAVQDARWQERGGALAASRDGRIVAAARYGRGSGQFSLVAEAGTGVAIDALLAALATRLSDAERHLALVSREAGIDEKALHRAGLAPIADYRLYCRRIAQVARDEGYVRAGIPVRGG